MSDATTTRAPSLSIDFSAPVTTGAPTSGGAGDGGAATSAACSKCGAPITGYYYESAGAVYCPKCRRLADEASAAANGSGGMVRAALYGLGAAVAGAAGYWAFMKVTNIEWAVVSVAVAVLVANAIRKGNGGQGGRKFQILALALTYLAIGGAYVPFILEGAAKGNEKRAAAAAAASNTDASATSPTASAQPTGASSAAGAASTLASDVDAVAAPAAPAPRGTAAKAKAQRPSPLVAIPVALGAVVLLALAAPVLVIVTGLPMSIINVAIIGFALQRAWLLLAGHGEAGGNGPSFSGPYNVRSRPAASAANASGPAPAHG